MTNDSLFFSDEEIQKLKSFFEQLHLKHRKYENDTFECKTDNNNSVFIFSWEGSEWGWHDESWYDIAKFVISKSLFIVLNGLETNDRRIRDIAEHAESIHITEHSTREFNNFETNKMVIAAEGFLGFHDRLRIDYSYSCGEC